MLCFWIDTPVFFFCFTKKKKMTSELFCLRLLILWNKSICRILVVLCKMCNLYGSFCSAKINFFSCCFKIYCFFTRSAFRDKNYNTLLPKCIAVVFGSVQKNIYIYSLIHLFIFSNRAILVGVALCWCLIYDLRKHCLSVFILVLDAVYLDVVLKDI